MTRRSPREIERAIERAEPDDTSDPDHEPGIAWRDGPDGPLMDAPADDPDREPLPEDADPLAIIEETVVETGWEPDYD